MDLSNRVKAIEGSKTVELSQLVQTLKDEGKDIISLNVGEPDFHTPKLIKDATISAIQADQTKYSLVAGLVELREKIAINYPIDLSAKNILVANGSKQVIYGLLQTICNPGDEVIVFRPYWVTFPESIKLAGGIPVFVDTTDDFQIDFRKLKQAISKKTKAIIFNSPNNPSGAVYPEVDLKKLATIACESNCYLIADEAYDLLTYEDNKHYSIGFSTKEFFDRTITIKTFSKSFCMTGYRIGYMIANAEITAAVNKLQGHLTGNNCTFAQYGAIAAMDLDSKVLNDMVDIYQERAKLTYSLFSQIFKCNKPQGAFYLFCDIRNFLCDKYKTCDEFARFILEQAHVALVPGIAFGQPGFLRISFAESEENIKLAFKRIKSIL